jgi:hypothetical protein
MADNEPDPLELFVVTCIRRLRVLLRTNTFWLTIAWCAWEFGRNIDAAWLSQHVNIKTWLPPTLAALAIMVKLLQIRNDEKT